MVRKIKTKNNVTSVVKQIEKKNGKELKEHENAPKIYISTPSYLFNCACAENPLYGLPGGRIVNIVGGSHTGKSIFALSTFSESNKYKKFKDYRFIYDDVENANCFNMPKMFGETTAKKIEAPSYFEDGEEKPSDMIEDFLCNIMDAIDDGRPFIYILDSLDALDAIDDRKKMEELREAKRKGVKAKGSYGMAKPKMMSWLLRTIKAPLKQTKSLLIIISQIRDNIDPFSFATESRSGGRALDFYCSIVSWLIQKKPIKSLNREIGSNVLAKITKNKINGKKREISFPIYDQYGIDNIRSCVHFMDDEGFWEKKKLTIDAHDLEIKGNVDTIIKHIEKNNLERKLAHCVGKAWMNIEDNVKIDRKSKYA